MAIDVGRDFHDRLTNRNRYQGDGGFTAEEFRDRYFKEIDNIDYWKKPNITIILDFSNVRKIGPSFANEAFAYFMKYTNPVRFQESVRFINISRVQKMIIEQELESGYSK